jgi:orotidine-5'-phosphate decarboxylase
MPKGSPSVSSKDRLIVALDVSDAQRALDLVRKLKSQVRIFKVGLQLLMSSGGLGILNRLGDEGVQVFLDLKMWDIPETVGRALRALQENHPHVVLATVHSFNRGLAAALKPSGAASSLRILVVTLLTSMDATDLAALGIHKTVDQFVLDEAKRAADAGCHGLIASPQEARKLREAFPHLAIVTPGIRPAWSVVSGDDQKRIATPRQAIADGADYIIVGRPVYQNPPNGDPAEAVRRIQEEIAAAERESGSSAGNRRAAAS